MEDLETKLKERNVIGENAKPSESFSDAFKALSNVFIMLKKDNGYLIDNLSFNTRIDYQERKYLCSIDISGDKFITLESTQEKALTKLAFKIYSHYLD
ncbi:MAG TPA: hypothetical protein VFM80_07025 [Gracilimonas sp.]|uniref:hypothetical protein n=1 Tax=Gracilimonas sp. TaxID=1974203 RepID=UPI002D9C40AF|nr:hypothetical protein [Gracilimonas sp.]